MFSLKRSWRLKAIESCMINPVHEQLQHFVRSCSLQLSSLTCTAVRTVITSLKAMFPLLLYISWPIVTLASFWIPVIRIRRTGLKRISFDLAILYKRILVMIWLLDILKPIIKKGFKPICKHNQLVFSRFLTTNMTTVENYHCPRWCHVNYRQRTVLFRKELIIR